MGRLMDTFIDKIAQKFTAQDVIKANAEAEERELQRLREQIAEYDARLSEIRSLNLKNLEIADKLEVYIEEQQKKIAEDKEVSDNKLEELATQLEEAMDSNRKAETESLDAIHKECVKVYRNVQAVVDQGFASQAEAISEQNRKIVKKVRGTKPLVIITMLLSAANLAVLLLNIFGILG